VGGGRERVVERVGVTEIDEREREKREERREKREEKTDRQTDRQRRERDDECLLSYSMTVQ
jgi:hypothetical protein